MNIGNALLFPNRMIYQSYKIFEKYRFIKIVSQHKNFDAYSIKSKQYSGTSLHKVAYLNTKVG